MTFVAEYWGCIFFFFTKYTVTHEQVTRSAPTREPDDTQNPYVNTRENKLSNVAALPAKKGSKLKKANEDGGGHVS